jgi:hypothetical protein
MEGGRCKMARTNRQMHSLQAAKAAAAAAVAVEGSSVENSGRASVAGCTAGWLHDSQQFAVQIFLQANLFFLQAIP